MKLSPHIKKASIETICLLYILLFVYAAVSKIIEFESFVNQIGQSPLLSPFAGVIAWMVPSIEIILAVLLLLPRTKILALHGALGLMAMFTAYIIIILNWSYFIPCSCGGVLSKMGWKEHLIFNIVYLVLAIIAIIISQTPPAGKALKAKLITVSSILVTCSLLVVSLYLLSEEQTHRNNGFLRRYPPHPVTYLRSIKLDYNSYYIAGAAKGQLYLANSTAPSHLLSIDTTLTGFVSHNVYVENDTKIKFLAPTLKIKGEDFFLTDGTVPTIFKGKIDKWHARLFWQGKQQFTQWEPVAGNTFVTSGIEPNSGENVLGSIWVNNGESYQSTTPLSTTPGGSIFDNDGMLRYNDAEQKLTYTYYYKNEFVLSDWQHHNKQNFQTIDTLKKSAPKIVSELSGQVQKISGKPVMINTFSCTFGKYQLVASDRLGRYEPEAMLKDATIVDVYDLKKHTYEFSFYLYNYDRKKIKSFQVYQNLLIGLTDDHLVIYTLQPLFFEI